MLGVELFEALRASAYGLLVEHGLVLDSQAIRVVGGEASGPQTPQCLKKSGWLLLLLLTGGFLRLSSSADERGGGVARERHRAACVVFQTYFVHVGPDLFVLHDPGGRLLTRVCRFLGQLRVRVFVAVLFGELLIIDVAKPVFHVVVVVAWFAALKNKKKSGVTLSSFNFASIKFAIKIFAE